MATRTGSRSALLVVDVQVGVVADAWERDRVVADDLNATMRWLSYPGRTHAVATAAGLDYGRLA